MWLHDDKIGYDCTYENEHAHQDAWSDDEDQFRDKSVQMPHLFDQSRFSASDGLVLTQNTAGSSWFLMISDDFCGVRLH